VLADRRHRRRLARRLRQLGRLAAVADRPRTALDGWTAGQPASSGTNANNWVRTDASGFPVGSTISTPDSLLFGFGFEGISSQSSRNAVMRRVLQHLLD